MIFVDATPYRAELSADRVALLDPAGGPSWRFRLLPPAQGTAGTIAPEDDRAAALLHGDQAFVARRALLWAAGLMHGGWVVWSISRTPAP